MTEPVNDESAAFQTRRERYDQGLCIDCGIEPHPAGKPRCEPCRQAYLGNKPEPTPYVATAAAPPCPHTDVFVEPGSDQVTCAQCGMKAQIVPPPNEQEPQPTETETP